MNKESQHKQLLEQQGSKKLLLTLVLVIIGMFGFAFALVPLYEVICEVTGLNGKPANEASSSPLAVNPDEKTREITVEFLANTSTGMPWDFKPVVSRVKVVPGESRTVEFYVKNRSQSTIVGQAIPSISPGLAAAHLKKIECFCFNEQLLEGGNDTKMPLVFYIDPELPKNIKTLTLSYTLYNITETAGLTASTHSVQGNKF